MNARASTALANPHFGGGQLEHKISHATPIGSANHVARMVVSVLGSAGITAGQIAKRAMNHHTAENARLSAPPLHEAIQRINGQQPGGSQAPGHRQGSPPLTASTYLLPQHVTVPQQPWLQQGRPRPSIGIHARLPIAGAP